LGSQEWELCLVVAGSLGLCLVVAGGPWFVIVPKSGPVHGATTHKNNTTMSLYGYGLTRYVVETSLGIPIGGANCVGAQSVWLEMRGLVGCIQHP
jgi:hypothetical protein